MRLQSLACLGLLSFVGLNWDLLVPMPVLGTTVAPGTSVNPQKQMIDRQVDAIINSLNVFVLNARGQLLEARVFYQAQKDELGLQRVLLAEAILAYHDGEYWQADMLVRRLSQQIDHPVQLQRRLLEAMLAVEQGNYRVANAQLAPIQAVLLASHRDDVALVTAEVLRYRGRYHAALTQVARVNRTNPVRIFQTTSLSADIYLDLGQYERAIALYETANQIQSVVSGTWGRRYRQQLARNQVNLGKAYRFLRQSEASQQAFQTAAATLKRLSDRDANVLLQVEIGLTQIEDQQFPAALQTFTQAWEMAQNRTKVATRVNVLTAWGRYHQAQSQFEPAIAKYQQAIELANRQDESMGYAKALTNLGEVYLKMQRWDDAIATLTQSVELYENMRPGLVDQDKVAIADSQAYVYQLLQAAQVGKGQQQSALMTAERGRARAFVEQLSRQLMTQTVPTVAPPTLAQMQATAQQERATLVSYSILRDPLTGLDQDLYIWVVPPQGEIQFRHVDLRQQPRATVAQIVQAARQATLGRLDGSAIKAALQPAHALLIQPIADLLPPNPHDRVVIIPQGSLFLVPFQALQDEQGQYLIEKHTLQIAPSIQALQLVQQRPSVATGQPLIIGNPQPMPENLAPLPGAEAEAKTIGQMFHTEALLGSQATEATVLEKMAQSSLLHFATHGLVDDERGLGSAIALVKGTSNDGFLTADEIFNLRLKANLAVLSACDTGRGRITGDGVIGLSRSFMSAGVPSVVVSLWAVPDQPTRFLMTDFYRHLRQQPDKAQALRQAMLNTMQQYPHPSDWASFVLVGSAD
jgi:CHAT domain-containing protein/predicted negative regulator of RcsB-dependent stress response